VGTVVLGPEEALDRASMRLANTLLGNPDTAAGLEVLLGGLKLRFVTGSAVAVTGAEGMVTLNGAEVPLNQAVRVPPGGVLAFGPALFGLRYYVGIQGGISVNAGSLPAGSLPAGATLKPGSMLTFGRPHGHVFPELNHPARRALDPQRPVVVRVSRGSQTQTYDAGTWLRLTSEPWILSPESDRAGARLSGRPLDRPLEARPLTWSLEDWPPEDRPLEDWPLENQPLDTAAEHTAAGAPPSQPLVSGSVLLPPSGLPLIALAGHPAAAHSPVIAVVRDEDLDLIGQARPGQMVHLLG